MRIAIWQQFSSNHSNNFTVVGTFASPDRAAEVAAEIRHILRTVAAYWKRIGEEDPQQQLWIKATIGGGYVTPPEVDFSQKYGVHWCKDGDIETTIDWIRWDEDKAQEAVQLFLNSVFVGNQGLGFGQSNVGVKPFDDILRKLGGEVAVDGELTGPILTTVVCDATDQDTAKQVMDTIEIQENPSFGKEYVITNVFWPARGKIHQEGTRITFMLELDVPEEFIALIAFLQRHFCTIVSYKFEDEQQGIK